MTFTTGFVLSKGRLLKFQSLFKVYAHCRTWATYIECDRQRAKVCGGNAAIIATTVPVLTQRPLKHASNLFGQNRVLLVVQTMRV